MESPEVQVFIQTTTTCLNLVENTLPKGQEIEHREAIINFEANLRILLGHLKDNLHSSIKPISEDEIEEVISTITGSKPL